MKIFLCAYRRIGKQVLEYLLNDHKKENIAVFNHEEDTDVSEYCQTNNVWYTFENINELKKYPFKPDMISCIYYAYIIKDSLIDICGGNIFNAHPSLLPNHRGCSAIPWAIIVGNEVTGITFHYIDSSIDTGKIILQATTQIRTNETQLSLYERIMDIGSIMWPAAFKLVMSGFEGIEQHGDVRNYHNRGCPYDGKINSKWSDEKVERFIRAMFFPPLPQATYKGIKIRTMKEYLNLKVN